MMDEKSRLAFFAHVDKRTVEKQADAFVRVMLGIELKDLENDEELRKFLSEKVEWSCEQ